MKKRARALVPQRDLSRAGKVYRTSNGRQNTFLKVESGGKADLTLSRFQLLRELAPGTTYRRTSP